MTITHDLEEVAAGHGSLFGRYLLRVFVSRDLSSNEESSWKRDLAKDCAGASVIANEMWRGFHQVVHGADMSKDSPGRAVGRLLGATDTAAATEYLLDLEGEIEADEFVFVDAAIAAFRNGIDHILMASAGQLADQPATQATAALALLLVSYQSAESIADSLGLDDGSLDDVLSEIDDLVTHLDEELLSLQGDARREASSRVVAALSDRNAA